MQTRLRNAILIGISSWVLFGAGLGFASANEAEPTFAVLGEYLVGDKATYAINYTFINPISSSKSPQNYEFALEWLPPEESLAGNGSTYMANVLATTSTIPNHLNWHVKSPSQGESYYPPGATNPAGAQIIFSKFAEGNGFPLVGESWNREFKISTYGPSMEACGLFHKTILNFSDNLTWSSCDWGADLFGNLSFSSNDGDIIYNGTLRDYFDDLYWTEITFRPGIPYPIKIDIRYDVSLSVFESISYDGRFIMEMESFERGTQLLNEHAEWGSFQKVPLTRMNAWGPQNNAYEGWALKDAYDYLVDNDDDISAAHKIATAFKEKEIRNQNEVELWKITFTDQTYRVLSRTAGNILDQLLPGQGLIQDETPLNVMINEIQYVDYPTTSPDLLALKNKWGHLVQDERMAELWGLSLGCGEIQFEQMNIICGEPRADLVLGGVYTEQNPFEDPLAHVSMVQISPNYINSWQTTTVPVSQISATTPPAEQKEMSSQAWVIPPAEATAGAGFVGLLLGALYYFKPAILGMFTRQIANPLEHPARAQLMSAIKAEPGVHFQELRRMTELGNGTARHHLEAMQKTHVVTRLDALGKTCYFPPGSRKSSMALTAASRMRGTDAVISALEVGPQTVSDIAAATGTSLSTVSHHVSRLRELGLVETKKKGRSTLVKKNW